MGSFDRLDVQVEGLLGWVLADGGIAGVGERAGLAVAEAGDIVFIAAKGLVFLGSDRLAICLLYAVVWWW